MSLPAPFSSSSTRLNLSILSLSLILTVTATAVFQGCGGQTPVFDQSVQHTPETLVEEFLARYKQLPANRKKLDATPSKPKAPAPDVDEAGKSSRKEASIKGEMLKESETLENVVTTLEQRLGQIPGVSRAEAAKKAAALIENEPAIKADDKSALVERLKQLN